MKRVLAAVLGLALALVGSMAVAAWLSTGSASATAAATSVARANAPVATRGAGHVDLSWAASTLVSGASVGGYRVLRHDGPDTTAICVVPATTLTCADPSPVATAVTYGVVATIGSWQGPESPTTTFTWDVAPPVTTASVSPTPNAAGWNKTVVSVTLAATDSGIASGVDHLSYTLDGGAPVIVPGATVTFPVAGTGSHPVAFYAVDAVGNVETTQALTVRIDPSAPTTSVTPSPAANAAGWNHTDVGLDFTAADSGTSGVASITVDGVTTDGATASRTVTAEGTTTVSYFATDVAGNVEGTKTTTVMIDRTAPTASIDPVDSTSWTHDNTVAVTANDALSGVASVRYTVDAGPLLTYTGTPFVLADGSHTVQVTVTDAAGNVLVESATIKVDTATPTSTIAATTSSTWTITASDAAPSSGVSIEWWIDGGAHTVDQAASTVVTVPTGSHTIHWLARDAAGNAQAQQDLPVTVAAVDTVAPTVSMTFPTTGISINNGQWTNNGCTLVGKPAGLCGTASDNVGVVGSAQYELRRTSASPNTCWNGSAFTQAACGAYQTAGGTGSSWQIPLAFSALPGGTFQLRVKVSDAAGNTNRSGTTPSGTPDITFTN